MCRPWVPTFAGTNGCVWNSKRKSLNASRAGGCGRRLCCRRVVLEIVVPLVIEPGERLLRRAYGEPLAVALEQLEPIELGQRVVDLEIDVDRERVLEPLLDAPVELVLRRRRGRCAQEIISQE